MTTSPRFDPEGIEDRAPTGRRSLLSSCLMGCGVIFVILLVVGGLVAFWVYRNWRGWVADFGSEAVKQSIAATDLPAEEKAEIGVQVDRVAEAFREQKITNRQLGAIMQQIVESPVMTSLIVSAVESKYIAASGLSDEEKTEGRKTMRRFARGLIDGKIADRDIDEALRHVADRDQNGNWQPRERVTDAELRAFLTAAKEQADAAEIPAEPETVDPSEEFRRIIDEAMGLRAEAEAE
jgi:hypothetical protein